MVDNYDWDVYYNYLDDIRETAWQSARFVHNYEATIEQGDYHKFVRELSLDYAIEFFTDFARNVLIEQVLAACDRTVEYSYQPYKEHLSAAISSNNEIIAVTKERGGATIRILMDKLGHPEEWIAAQKAAYAPKIPNEQVRAKIWREKIYGVDREGAKVTKIFKQKDEETGEKKEVERDITERYKGKYEQTIRERLSLLPASRAPFWYFIENGNSQFTGEASPYPVESPTLFVQTTQLLLADLLEAAIQHFYDAADARAEIIWESAAEEYVHSIPPPRTPQKTTPSAGTVRGVENVVNEWLQEHPETGKEAAELLDRRLAEFNSALREQGLQLESRTYSKRGVVVQARALTGEYGQRPGTFISLKVLDR